MFVGKQEDGKKVRGYRGLRGGPGVNLNLIRTCYLNSRIPTCLSPYWTEINFYADFATRRVLYPENYSVFVSGWESNWGAQNPPFCDKIPVFP